MTEKTTSTRKPSTSAKNTSAAKKQEETKQEKPVKEEKRKITPETEVEVFNNTHGRLVYTARKGNGYLFLEHFMDSDVMTVEELQVMKNAHRKILTDGWIYVDDEDVLDYLRLGNLKDSVKDPETLEDIVSNSNPDAIMDAFNKLGANSKGAMYNIIKEKYKTHDFTNAHVIKDIEAKLGIASDLSLLAD